MAEYSPALKIGIQAQDTDRDFVHGMVIDETNDHMYLIRAGVDEGKGSGDEISLLKVELDTSSGDYLEVIAATKLSNSSLLQALQIQGICQDSASVYVFYDLIGGADVSRVAKFTKSTMALSCDRKASASSYSEFGVIEDDKNSDSCVYHIGGGALLNYGDGTTLWKRYASDLTLETYNKRWHTDDVQLGIGIFKIPGTDDFIILGSARGRPLDDGTRDSGSPILYRVTESLDGSGNTTFDVTDAITFVIDGTSSVDWDELDDDDVADIDCQCMFWDLVFDPDYSTNKTIWACGGIPKDGSSGGDGTGGDGFIAKIVINGSDELTAPKIWRVSSSDAYSFRLGAIRHNIESSTDYLYLTTTYLMHNNLGDTTEVNVSHSLRTMKIDLAELDDGDASMGLVWCRALNAPGDTARSGAFPGTMGINNNKLYVAGTTTIESRGYRACFVAEYPLDEVEDAASNPVDLSDGDGIFSDRSVTADVTISDITSALNIDRETTSDLSLSEQAGQDGGVASESWTNEFTDWDSTVYDVNTDSLTLILIPDAIVGGGNNTMPRDESGVITVNTSAHEEAIDNYDDGPSGWWDTYLQDAGATIIKKELFYLQTPAEAKPTNTPDDDVACIDKLTVQISYKKSVSLLKKSEVWPWIEVNSTSDLHDAYEVANDGNEYEYPIDLSGSDAENWEWTTDPDNSGERFTFADLSSNNVKAGFQLRNTASVGWATSSVAYVIAKITYRYYIYYYPPHILNEFDEMFTVEEVDGDIRFATLRPLASSLTASSDVASFDAIVQKPLAGSIAAGSTFASFDMSVLKPLVSSLSAGSTFASPDLLRAIILVSSMSAASTIDSLDLSRRIDLAASLAASSDFASFDAIVTRPLASSLTASSDFASFDAVVLKPLVSSLTAGSTIDALDAIIYIALIGSMSAGSTINSLDLLKTVPLASSLSAGSTIDSLAAYITRNLAGSMAAGSTFASLSIGGDFVTYLENLTVVSATPVFSIGSSSPVLSAVPLTSDDSKVESGPSDLTATPSTPESTVED